ncbi:MAG: hypothetical protein V3S49_04935 [Thermodesulfobacteriota bacterium]
MGKESENNNQATLPFANLEPNFGNASLGKEKIKRLATLVSIRVISYRKLKHDPDGISAKAVIDGLVHAGILGDDSWEQVKSVTFESRKTKRCEEEKTIIEIIEIEEGG